MTVDGNNATHYIKTGDILYKLDGTVVGTVTGVTSTSVTVGAGTAAAVVDNDELFTSPPPPIRGNTNQSTAVHEIFDIIEHTSHSGKARLVVQPSDRTRFSQGSRLENSVLGGNSATIEHLLSRGRVLSFGEDNYGNSTLRAHGLISLTI